MPRHLRPREMAIESQAARNRASLLRAGGRMQISSAEELVASVTTGVTWAAFGPNAAWILSAMLGAQSNISRGPSSKVLRLKYLN